MKRIKYLLFVLILTGLTFVLTACSGVDSPTLTQVKAAIGEKGYIMGYNSSTMESQVSGYSYEIAIQEIKQSGDMADVVATLTEKYGVLSCRRKLKLRFQLKSDGISWGLSKIEQEGEPVTRLEGRINLRKAKILFLETEGVMVGDEEIKEDDVISFTPVADSVVDQDGMTETYTFTCKAKRGINTLTYTATVVYKYTMNNSIEYGSWAVDSYTIDSDYYLAYSDSYLTSSIDPEALADYIETKISKMYVLGCTYNGWNEKVDVRNVKIDEYEVSGESYIHLPVKFDMVVGEDYIVVTYSAKVDFMYIKGRWEPYFVSDAEIVGMTGDYVGTWTGSYDEKSATLSINMTDQVDEKGRPVVQVVVMSSDVNLATYSWFGRLVEYDPLGDGYMRVQFYEWITLPASGDEYAYEEFSGNVEFGSWISDNDWQKFALVHE